jgi:hypothetical protein
MGCLFSNLGTRQYFGLWLWVHLYGPYFTIARRVVECLQCVRVCLVLLENRPGDFADSQSSLSPTRITVSFLPPSKVNQLAGRYQSV